MSPSFSIGNPIRFPREHKGNSLIAFPSDYVVVDLETTGLDPYWNVILEIGALKIVNHTIVDSFSSLVYYADEMDDTITELTGITSEMVQAAPPLQEVLRNFLAFVGNHTVVAHNAHFDINFLYDNAYRELDHIFSNDFIDTLRIARRVLPELKHHRLIDITEALQIDTETVHRAADDCKTTYLAFEKMREIVSAKDTIENFVKKTNNKLHLQEISATTSDFSEDHPFYGKHCTFTGALERMSRADAAQLVVNAGGICDNSVTVKTNYLILGNTDYCNNVKGNKTNKFKKAEQYKLKGLDIEIISENVFYDML